MTEWLNWTEDEMVGWHHQLNGHEFEQALGSWWRTGKPGMLQSMGLQRAGHTTEHRTTGSSYIFNFWETLYHFPKWLHQFIIPPTVYEYPFFSSPAAAHLLFLFGSSHYNWYKSILIVVLDFPCGSALNICLQCRKHRRCRFDPWVSNIPWRRKWQPAPVFLHTLVLIFAFLVISNVEWFFIYLLAIFISSIDKCLFSSFPHF